MNVVWALLIVHGVTWNNAISFTIDGFKTKQECEKAIEFAKAQEDDFVARNGASYECVAHPKQ